MTWSLYQNNEFLKPLTFSNGKTQEDIVKEVLNEIGNGHKVIFVHGICGTGKSAIALNIARELGKTSIIVPIKNLQKQYQTDYCDGQKYLLKKDKEKLKISVITGRNNHKCKFLEDAQNNVPKIKKEINAKLHDIFADKLKQTTDLISEDISADNRNIPCKIEIKENNWKRIKEYLRKNKDVDEKKFNDIKDVKRISVAGVCPYFSPVIPEKYELGGESFANSVKRKYQGLKSEFIFYVRKPGCKFYEQFHSFIDADVIVFNSLKYKLESSLGRKPQTEVEIIDECDEFLDSFANQKSLNLNRLQNSLIRIISFDEKIEKNLQELHNIIKQIKQNQRISNSILSGEIIPLKETGIYDLLRMLLQTPELLDDIDEENYLFDAAETARMFEDFFDETYLTTSKKENGLIFGLVTTNLAKKFKEVVDNNKTIVLMSGTLHSENILTNVFGLTNFKTIEAEGENQGRIETQRTGLEMDCKYSNFSAGKFKRKNYLKALNKCVEVAEKPVLVHVHAFLDLPSKQEIEEYELNNLISREKLKELQKEDKTGELIDKFKTGLNDVLFSTRASRGIDFPGKVCNSIIFTKYPNPNVRDAFWKILQKTNPEHYWEFYKDKARRELWQKVYRGLRFKEDHVYVLSPDSRVLEAFE